MPYTQEYAIGFALFTFWITTAFISAGLLRSYIDAPDAGNARYLRAEQRGKGQDYPYCIPIEAREPFIVNRP